MRQSVVVAPKLPQPAAVGKGLRTVIQWMRPRIDASIGASAKSQLLVTNRDCFVTGLHRMLKGGAGRAGPAD